MTRTEMRPIATRLLWLAVALTVAAIVYYLLRTHSEMNSREAHAISGAIAIAAFAAVLWISEALPLAVTALLIPVGLSALSVLDVTDAYAPFGNDVLFLVLGGYGIAAAVGANGIDRWLAHGLLARAGTRTFRVTVALMGTSATLSMLISNTATTALLLPVALGIVAGQKDINLTRLLPLSIAYGASIGGVATLIGSPPNALVAGLLDIDFASWMVMALPVSLIMFVLALPVLWFTFRPTQTHIDVQLGERTNLSPAALRTTWILLLTVALWLLAPGITERFALPAALSSAASIACIAVALLMLTDCVTWKELESRVEWGVLLLLGGGLALGKGLTHSGAADWLAGLLVAMVGDLPIAAILIIVVTIAVFATELISNTATTAKLAPVMIGVAAQLGLTAESLVVPIAIATSMAFMLPVATPPNAIVYATGYVAQRDMIRAGFRLNVVAVAAISLIFLLAM